MLPTSEMYTNLRTHIHVSLDLARFSSFVLTVYELDLYFGLLLLGYLALAGNLLLDRKEIGFSLICVVQRGGTGQ
jgi:hypothetical protein